MRSIQTFSRNERLRSRKQIETVFASGKSFTAYPIRLLVCVVENKDSAAQSLFVVPKRSFKKAHDRNRLRRRMKEAFRLNKHPFYEVLSAAGQQRALAFVYTGRQDEPYQVIEKAVVKLLKKIGETVTSC